MPEQCFEILQRGLFERAVALGGHKVRDLDQLSRLV